MDGAGRDRPRGGLNLVADQFAPWPRMSKSREEKKRKKQELRERQKGPAPLFKEGQIPPLSDMPQHLTLNQVYGWPPCGPEDRFSGLTTRLCDLRETPLGEIDPEDVCFLLRHHHGVEVFIDQALAWLEQDPLADMQYYDGDLLAAVLTLDAQHLVTAGRAPRLIAIAERALSDLRTEDEIEWPSDKEMRMWIAAQIDRLRATLPASA